MNNITEEILKKVETSPFKAIVLAHLNESAETEIELFTKNIPNKRIPPFFVPESKKNRLSHFFLLNTIFEFAPTEVCHEVIDCLLKEPDFTLVKELKAIKDSSLHQGLEWVMETLLKKAPREIKIKVVSHLVDLKQEEIIDCLFGDSFYPRHFDRFMKLIDFNDDEITIPLINALLKLKNTSLLSLLQTSPFPFTAHDALIHFFSKKPSEEIALAALKIIQLFEGKDLSKLVWGGNFLNKSSSNLLHVVFASQSEPVVISLLQYLIEKLPIDQVIKLLTAKNMGDALTPLELTFLRTDNHDLVLGLTKFLYQNSALRPLLTGVSISQFHSLIHLGVMHQHHEAVTFFIEQEDSPINHTVFSSSKTLFDLANSRGDEQMTALCLAFKILKWIENPALDPSFSLDLAEDLIKKNPRIASIQFSQKKSLLSYAASLGESRIVSSLLAEGAVISEDIDQRTAIDEALSHRHLPVLIAFTEGNPSIDVLKNLCRALSKRSIKRPPIYDHLQKILTNSQPALSWDEMLLNYCHGEGDAFVFLLLKVVRLYQENESDELRTELVNFISLQLDKIQKTTTLIEKNALELELIILFFTLGFDQVKKIIPLLFLNDQSKEYVNCVFLKGLTQGSILNQFTMQEHQNYHALLIELSADKENALNPLAHYYFQNTALHLIPPDIIINFSKLLSLDFLQACNKKRCSAPLLILTIQKLLANSPIQEEVDVLLKKLTLEFQLLLKTDNQEELYYCLNLITHPTLKQNLGKILAVDLSAEIQQKTKQFFIDYNHKKPLIQQSFLRDTFLHLMTQKDFILSLENQNAIKELLSILTVEEIKNLYPFLEAHLSEGTQHHLMNQFAFENDPLMLQYWLIQLKENDSRMQLASIIEPLDNWQRKARYLFSILDDDFPEYKAILKKNIGLIATLSSNLFDIHLGKEDSLSVDSIPLQIDTILFHYKTLITTIETIAPSELTEEVHALTKELKDFPISTLLSQRRLLFQASHQELNIEVKQDLSYFELFKTKIVKGLLSNQNRKEIFPLLFHWVLTSDLDAGDALFYTHLVEFVHDPICDQTAIIKELELIIGLKNNLFSLLLDLQVLTISNFNLDDLLKLFYDAEELLLQQLIEYCTLTKLDDFKDFASYILKAKQNKTPLDILKIQNKSFKEINLNHWLSTQLEAVEKRATRAISIKIVQEGLYSTLDTINRLSRVAKLVSNTDAKPHAEVILIFLKSYLPSLEALEESDERQQFIQTFSDILKKAHCQVIPDILNQLPTPLFESLLNTCAEGLHSNNLTFAKASKYLLTQFCQIPGNKSPRILSTIKSNLGKKDLKLLNDESLIELADTLLNSSSSTLLDETIDGVWIQRLLTSPRFIAACNPQIIQALIERYRLISLTLKQDEFDRLNAWIRKNLEFYEYHQKALPQIDEAIQHNLKRDSLIKKRERLLSFRADDSIRALLTQLQENCEELKKDYPELSDLALNNLYSYYNQSVCSLRSDLIFRLGDFLVNSFCTNKGDLDRANSNLIQWLMHYLPHKNFEQLELSRKLDTSLYNALGQKIGFITDDNLAMTFLEDEPRPLQEHQEAYPNMPLYDSNRCVIGSLSSTGHFIRENIFQKNTSALLLAKVPTEQLERSPAAIQLLLHDVFNEESLNIVFLDCKEDKHAFLEKAIHHFLSHTKKIIPKENFKVITNNQSIDSTFNLLNGISLKDNAQGLFDSLLENDKLREELFTSSREKNIFAFFDNNNSAELLANFLIKYHDKPWFAQGFLLFSNYANAKNKEIILIEALDILKEKLIKHKSLLEEHYHAILQTLLSTEASTMIWTNFLKADLHTPVQEVSVPMAKALTSFFTKTHCTFLLKSLNAKENWVSNASYRLLLLTLLHQHDEIFKQSELRYSENQAWSSKELTQITEFTKQHLSQKLNVDKNFALGEKLLGELVFRCANFGQVEFFNNKAGQFDPKFANKTIKSSYMDDLVARFYIFRPVKHAIENFFSAVKQFFNNTPVENGQIKKLLEENQAIIDWKKIRNDSHEVSSNLSLFSAFIINYSGPKEPLIQLIRDYCLSAVKKPEAFQQLTKIMSEFPQRDVSCYLFILLEEIATDKPEIINKSILKDLTQFYAYQTHTETNELDLIKHFGLQKKYALVDRCCKLLSQSHFNPGTLGNLKKTSQIAQVEGQLSTIINKWYFKLFAFVKRLWHYGFNNHYENFGWINYCDSKDEYLNPIKPEPQIKTPVLGGKTIEQNLRWTKKFRALRERYDNFLQNEQQKHPPVKTESMAPIAELGFFSEGKEIQASKKEIKEVFLVNCEPKLDCL